MRDVLIWAFWILAATLVLLLAGWWLVRVVALRIARRVAEEAEQRVHAGVGHGLHRVGVPETLLGVSDPATRARYLRQIETLARVMDRLIPLPIIGGVGLDAILGLVPAVGDALSFALSSTIVIRAAQLGVPRELISRMIAIQLTDLAAGAVPVAGDLFDAAYSANVKCAALVKDFSRAASAARRATS